MAGTNGTGHHVGGDTLPDGAVVLTLDILEQHSRRWVKLPGMSARVAELTIEDLQREGFLPPLATLQAQHDGDTTKAAEALAEAAKRLKGRGIWVEVEAVEPSLLFSLMPYIPGSETWGKSPEERQAAWTTWRAGLTEEERLRYDIAVSNSNYAIAAAGLATPKVTAAQARRFKGDLLWLVDQIVKMSGAAAPESVPTTATPAPQEDPPAAA